jgi:hypothetical protein
LSVSHSIVAGGRLIGPKRCSTAATHEVANIFSLDAFGRRDMAHSLAVTAFERKGDAHLFEILACDLEAVRAPAEVRCATAILPSCRGIVTLSACRP